MAKFEDVLPALREGKKIRRKSWGRESYVQIAENHWETWEIEFKDLLDDDWEIAEETPLPCPFCGGPAEISWSYYFDQPRQVGCRVCRGTGPICDTEGRAIELWNKAKR